MPDDLDIEPQDDSYISEEFIFWLTDSPEDAQAFTSTLFDIQDLDTASFDATLEEIQALPQVSTCTDLVVHS